MARVWAESQHGGSVLLMLLSIADFADDEGNAYPGVQTLAEKCRVTARAANHTLAILRRSGELEVRLNEGPRGTNRYRIVVPAPAKGVQNIAGVQSVSAVQPIASTPVKDYLKPLQRISDEPSENHQEPSGTTGKPSRRKPVKTFDGWYASTNHPKERLLRDNDPLEVYIDKVGLDMDFLRLHFDYFKSKYSGTSKVQSDWLQAFRNSVKGNYGSLWFRTSEGSYALTTAGKQAALEHDHDPNMRSERRRPDLEYV